MDASLVNELRDVVQPAVEQMIALAAERGLSRLAISQDGLEISIERPPGASPVAAGEESEPSAETSVAVAEEEHHRLTPVLSTLVGVFKTRISPDKAPASAVGAKVGAGHVLGYIDSMRLTYEIHAPCGGQVAEILVEDGHPVEYGQALMVLEEAE